MPIQVDERRFIQFRYEPDYLVGKYQRLRADGNIGRTLAWLDDCLDSDIVLEGGNLAHCSNKVILTDRVLTDNPRWGRTELADRLKRLQEVHEVILIPPEPGDITGHADEVVRFVNDGLAAVNEYRRIDRGYHRSVAACLRCAGLAIELIPYRPVTVRVHRMPSAVGNYANFLHAGPVLIVLSYGMRLDAKAADLMRELFPALAVRSLPSVGLADQGGVLNCVTSTFRLCQASGPNSLRNRAPG